MSLFTNTEDTAYGLSEILGRGGEGHCRPRLCMSRQKQTPIKSQLLPSCNVTHTYRWLRATEMQVTLEISICKNLTNFPRVVFYSKTESLLNRSQWPKQGRVSYPKNAQFVLFPPWSQRHFIWSSHIHFSSHPARGYSDM